MAQPDGRRPALAGTGATTHSPPGKEKAGPHGKDRPSEKNIDHHADPISVDQAGDNARFQRRHVVSCIHGRPRFCQPCLGGRRRVAWLLDEAIAALHPRVKGQTPGTFGLDDDQLRAHGNDLWAQGWTITEICQVLDVDPARSS